MTLRLPVPDLLMRFAPTPYRLISKGLVIETNDLDILDQFDGPNGVVPLLSSIPNLHIRIVRDASVSEISGEVQASEFGPLRVVTIGTGTVLFFDRELHRLFGFVASRVPAHTLVESYLFGALLSNSENPLIPKA